MRLFRLKGEVNAFGEAFCYNCSFLGTAVDKSSTSIKEWHLTLQTLSLRFLG